MQITRLYIHPLKSARALGLQEARLDEFGIEGDEAPRSNQVQGCSGSSTGRNV